MTRLPRFDGTGRRPRLGLSLGCLAIFSTVAVAAAPDARVAPPVRAFDLEARLESLDPARPIMYLELAEELADGLASGESSDRGLARRLYGLAGRLDPEGLASSAALGIASLSIDARAAARYRAAAALLDPDAGGTVVMQRPGVDLETAFEISEAFSAFRLGRFSRLREHLEDPTSERALRAWDASLPGGVDWLKQQVKSGGKNRPALARSEALAMVRIELALLDLGRPSWSTLIAIDGDPPLIDLRADRVLEMLLDDDAATRPVRRNGQWVAR